MQLTDPAALHGREHDRRQRAPPAMIQNDSGGRSLPRTTAVTAVAAGSSAMTTAP
nr:hypothetical protein JVH1_4589 [Rhodococcus sp. JVH1]